MPIQIQGTGEKSQASLTNRTDFSSTPTYSFCSPLVTTTASYAQHQFGVKLSEIYIVNMGNAPICFQFPEYFGTTKDSGVVPAGDKIVFRKSLQSGIAVRSADPAVHSQVVIFGV